MDGRQAATGRRGAFGVKPVFACAMALLAAPLAAQDRYAEYEAYLEEFRKQNNIPALSAVILKDRRIVWEGYFGTYDDEGDMPTIAETTYSIASVTKPIAATAIIAESRAGGFDLDLPMAGDEAWAEVCAFFITRDAIPFMAGGVDQDGNAIAPMDCDKPTTLAQMLDMRANGEAFVYNPIAFARIDRAIAAAGGRDLRAMVRDRVVEPAGMRNVALGWHDPEEGDALRYLAAPHHVVDGRIVKQAISDDDFRASAGIKTSPRAIAAFDIAFDNGVFLPQSHRRSLVESEIPPLGDYRMGWWLEDWNGKRLIWHSGKDDERYSAVYLKVPEDELTLIVLGNAETIWGPTSTVKAEVSDAPVAAKFLELFVR